MTPKNFILASSAKWVEMLIIILVNIFTVPIILSKWGPEIFGAWLLLQGVLVYINLPNLAYQEFIHNINLKLGAKKKREISTNIASGIPLTVLISLIIVCLLIIELNFQILTNNLNVPDYLKKEWTLALFIFGIYSIITYSINPFLTHVTHIFGYLPLFTWIGTIRFFFSQIAILISISLFNASLVKAFIVSLLAQIIVHIIEYIIVFYIFKKEGLKFVSINMKKGLDNYVKSLWLAFTFIIENIGTNGLRIIITAMSNPAILVIFATIRTIINTLVHAIDSIGPSFLTELMKNFSLKKIKSINMNYELYYLFISILVFPLIIILQFFIEDIYIIWTLGKIDFDVNTYTFLIISVLIICVNFPFRITISGNNLVKEKFNISLIKNIFLLIFIYITYEHLKILSFSIGLLLSEILNLFLNYFIIKRFFKKVFFNFKDKIFRITIINLLIASIMSILLLIVGSENQYRALILPCFILYPIIIAYMIKKLDQKTLNYMKSLYK